MMIFFEPRVFFRAVARYRRLLLLLALHFSALGRADSGWIPEYQRVTLKTGFDYFHTGENFDSGGSIAPLLVGNQPLSLTDLVFWLEPEAGIAEDWSAYIRANFLSSSATSSISGLSLLSGTGFGDTRLGLKWAVSPGKPRLTLEVFAKLPTGSSKPSTTSDLVLGEGNFDLGFRIHTSTRQGMFVFGLSPGILGRFGGYSTAAIGDGFVQLQFSRGYVRAFADVIYSFTDNLLYDTSFLRHDTVGTAGSYSRLNPSPIGFSAGGKVGAKITEGFSMEIAASRALGGQNYPLFTLVSTNLFFTFDFFEPVKPIRVKEVPFEGEAPAQFPN